MTQRFLRILGSAAWVAAAACVPDSDPAEDFPGANPRANAQSATEAGTRFADPVRVSPEQYRILETTPAIRVLAAAWHGGAKDESHSHPTTIWYALTDMRLRIEVPNALPLTRRISAGNSGVQPPLHLHSVQNIGVQTAKIVMFEIESGSAIAREASSRPEPLAPMAISVSNDFRLLEQHAGYRMVLATLEPERMVELHSHPPSVWFALDAGRLRFSELGSKPLEVSFQAGDSGIRPAVPAHTVVNLGTEVTRFLFLESPGKSTRGSI
jgi:oxalate decarboxylase/phosphoglucose isomerase-like protein (cupin superfamily)